MSVALLLNCKKVKLPIGFDVMFNNIDPILDWLGTIGERNVDWYYSITQHAFFFLREENAIIFRLKFGI